MHRLDIWSASALFVMGLVYIIVVAAAMISGGGYTNPIGDPLLSVDGCGVRLRSISIRGATTTSSVSTE
jgi:hypothetical protein